MSWLNKRDAIVHRIWTREVYLDRQRFTSIYPISIRLLSKW